MQKLAKALATFRSKVPAIKKDRENPFFKSSYATLDNILETIKPALLEANLSVIQVPLEGGKLRTVIYETESGESIEGTMDILIGKNDPQGQGSAISYARRYALASMLGLATEEDDDGNASSAPVAPKPAQKVCVQCKKPHTGQYPKCLDCYKSQA
jgi:hypothetical protein